MSAEPTTENKELSELLAPFMREPFTPPKMLEAGLTFLLGKMGEALARNSEADTTQAKGCAAWMTMTELAAHFNYHRTTMHRMITPSVEAGKIRMIQPPDDGCKREPNRKYCVADVLAVLEVKNPTKNKESHENAEA